MTIFSSMRHASILGCTVFFAAAMAAAQTAASNDSSANAAPPAWSSSQAGLTEIAEANAPALPSAPAPAGARQESDNTYSGWHGHGLTHRLTWEAGGGFNAPVGNDGPYITWGGNLTVGAGIRFSRRVSALLEYQFMDNKLPGAFIAAADTACSASYGSDCGITGGSAHINSITGSPVIDLTPKWKNGIYAVGGWGYYHKSTNFSAPEEAYDIYYGYYYAQVTVASFTSNQWGGNAGLGIYHRLGGMYGEGHSQIFAEARYTFIHTPPLSQNNGLGTTGLIPVTFGVRF